MNCTVAVKKGCVVHEANEAEFICYSLCLQCLQGGIKILELTLFLVIVHVNFMTVPKLDRCA